MTESDATWLITLVHGTWARATPDRRLPRRDMFGRRRRRWYQTASYFRRRLRWNLDRDEVVADIASFLWSGSNSILERDRAGAALARHLVAQAAACPGRRQMIVGHSHGGNVAIRALAWLPPDHPDVAVVTLATPFVELFPAAKRLPSPRYSIAVMVLAGLPAWVAGQLAPDWAPLAASAVIVVTMAVFILDFWLADAGHPPFRVGTIDRLVTASSHAVLDRRADPVLVLRGVDDEASLALAAGGIVSVLGRHAVGLTVALACLAALLPATSLLGIPDDAFPTAGTIVGLALAAFSVTVCIDGLARCVFGRELFFSLLDVEISSNSAPDRARNLAVRTIVRGSAEHVRSRHALYDDPGSADEIALWVRELDDGSPGPRCCDERRMRWVPQGSFRWWQRIPEGTREGHDLS